MSHRPTPASTGRTNISSIGDTRRALRAASRAARRPAIPPAQRAALLAIGSLFAVPAALALLAPHVLEGLIAMASHGSEPWLAWGALALLAGLPLTLAGLPWTPRAHAEIDATLVALAHAIAADPAPQTNPARASAAWPAAETTTRRAA